jgi:hypothetical protein
MNQPMPECCVDDAEVQWDADQGNAAQVEGGHD